MDNKIKLWKGCFIRYVKREEVVSKLENAVSKRENENEYQVFSEFAKEIINRIDKISTIQIYQDGNGRIFYKHNFEQRKTDYVREENAVLLNKILFYHNDDSNNDKTFVIEPEDEAEFDEIITNLVGIFENVK